MLNIFLFCPVKRKMLLSERPEEAGEEKKYKEDISPIDRRKKEDKTHLVEENETLPKPQTEKNEIGIYGGL